MRDMSVVEKLGLAFLFGVAVFVISMAIVGA